MPDTPRKSYADLFRTPEFSPLFLSTSANIAAQTVSGLALGTPLVPAAATAALALPGLPVWAMLAIVLAEGLIASLGGGVRWGLLNEILTKDGYLAGRSLFNMMSGVMQITGYAAGGVL
ncbi:hypothetical protein B5181_38475, partial [Streptomyces sp. 4F]